MSLKLVSSQESVGPYTFEEFADAIQSDRVAYVVSNQISVETGITNFDLSKVAIQDIGYPQKNDSEFGVCAVIPIGRKRDSREPLIVDEQFPTFLLEQTDMDRKRALDSAAVFARSLFVVNRAFSVAAKTGDTSRVLFKNTEVDRYWETVMLHSRQRRVYRAAGTITLNSLQIDFDIPQKPPYPSHIAGLMNPLPSSSGNAIKGTFRELHEMLHYIHK